MVSKAQDSYISDQSADWDTLGTQDKWQVLNQSINKATKESCKTKVSSIHSNPFWTKELTESSKVLREAKKAYTKRNTLSNKDVMDLAKEKFDEMRKRECQNFILQRTQISMLLRPNSSGKVLIICLLEKTRMVSSLKDYYGNFLTEPEDIEKSLFGSFFACKHSGVPSQTP